MTKSPGVERRFKKQRKQPKLKEMEVDRISNLPGHVVDKILSRLTLRDAVRTSILSRNWRYNWRNLTSLVFDYESILVFSEDTPISVDNVVKIVDHVLLLHNGPIHKFKLSHHDACHNDIDRWILFLSQGSVKELILEIPETFLDDPYYKIPSSLYLCEKLSHLQLWNCSLKPSLAFNGFKILTSLHLSDIMMDQDLLENLIYSCPLLERLTLLAFYKLAHLKIHAPKLTFFNFRGVFEDVKFENTVHLSTVSIFVNNHESSLRTTSKLIKFFASLPNIQRVKLWRSVLQILAGDMVPRRLPTPCIKLNYLSLEMDFNDMEQCVAALCILRSSPNLMELQIYSSAAPRAVTNKLMIDYYQNFFLNRLRLVNIVGICGVPRELNFISFLLANSPILETMTVNPASEDCGMELRKELRRFRRASTHAKIIYLDP